jgi:hypothetical protein
VFPCHDIATGVCSCKQSCSSPGKHPRSARGFHDATTDPVTIAAWWKMYPHANIGIDCGRSGLSVADVDVKKGARGEATLRWFLERSPAFSETFLVTTPTGGYHFYFAGTTEHGGQGALGEGIDLQSTGRYVLAPPSVAPSQYDEHKRPVPGSAGSYVVTRAAPIQPFPTDVLPNKAVADEYDFSSRTFDGPERAAIPYGEHRQALLWMGWHLRSVQGLTVEGALPIMRGMLTALDRYNPQHPFSDRELRGMLSNVKPNIASAPPPGAGTFIEAIENAATVIAAGQPARQIVLDGLLIQGDLHVFYGDEGIGKTTIMAYLLALVTLQGKDVLVFISEDLPREFAMVFYHAGGDLTKLHFYNAGKSVRDFLLPKCKVDLEQIIAARPLGAIYFDSILDLRSGDSRENAANEARALFGPLQTLANRYNTSIICTAHTNKQGVLEGARQIRAKARVVAKLERPAQRVIADGSDYVFDGGDTGLDPHWNTVITVEKFKRGANGRRYNFTFETTAAVDPYTGREDIEYDAGGQPQPVMLYVTRSHQELPPVVQPVTPAPPRADLEAKIRTLLANDPTISVREILKRVGGRSSDVCAIAKKVRGG